MSDNVNRSGWATYLRVSDEDKQTPERSFAMQRQRIQEGLINGSEVPFFNEYRDMLTGTSPNRADYQKLLADAEAGKFSHLGLYRADRFGRDTVEGLQSATRLISLGIKIRVAHMPSLMPETPDGFFMFLLQMGMAQREVDVLRQRTSDGMEAKIRAGGWSHKAPEGYCNKERLVSSNKYERWVEQDPGSIQMVKDAYDLLLEDRYTLDEICEELNNRGYSRQKGSPWVWNDAKTGKRVTAKNTLSKLYHNPFYAGWAVSTKFGIKIGEVRGNWQPVITHEEFQRCLSILKKHDQDKSRDRKHFYLLKGLLWVEIDGVKYKMTGSSPAAHGKFYPYYTTTSKPNGKDLNFQCYLIDQQISSWLNNIAISKEKITPLKELYKTQVIKKMSDDAEIQTKKFQAKLGLLKNEEARLGRLYITEKISENTYNQLRTEWQDNIRSIELKIAEAQRDTNSVLVDLDLAIILLSHVQELFKRLDEKSKCKLLRILLKRIIINSSGEIIDQELHSPFTYLYYLGRTLEEPPGGDFDGSEQVSVGALQKKSPQGGFFVLTNRITESLCPQEDGLAPENQKNR